MALFDKFTASGRTTRTQVDSILGNLENVLNTKRGWGSPLPDFGIRTLTEYTSREDISKAVIREIRDCIERYEPRLRVDSIAVEEQDRGPFRLSFTLRCSLVDGTQVLRVSVNTLFGSFDVARG
jgi:type VI secretion system protein